MLRPHYRESTFKTVPFMYYYTDATAPISVGQKWHNELGSTMVITSFDPETGVFGGHYETLVGDATKWYVLTGRRDLDGKTTGWTVNWQNSHKNAHSVTTWSGQYQFTSIGEPVIVTTWLLTSQTTPDDDWESTLVGFDRFTQSPPLQETTEKAKLNCYRSHPKEA